MFKRLPQEVRAELPTVPIRAAGAAYSVEQGLLVSALTEEGDELVMEVGLEVKHQ